MNGITYFRLNSPYDGDVTKNCALTGNEVDNNFYTLEGRDVKSVELKDSKIVVTLMNGDKLTTDSITEGYTKDLSFDFDEANGVLTITRNGVTETIGGFVTSHNVNNSIAVDGSVIGNGLFDKPVGLSPMFKTGQYRPVKKIIDMTNNEKLPSCDEVAAGDRFLTIENVNEFGYLYNYQGLREIACRLHEMNSQWRIPTKEDWDDLLDSVEPCEEFRNHTDARSNKFLGKFAGKFLKSKNYWKKEQPCDCNCNQDINCHHGMNDVNETEEHNCVCGRNIPCTPNYCGEYGTCHHRHGCNNEGIGKFGFNVLPAGYANEAKDFLYFKERAYFWTASNHECRDAYIKAFAYNKSTVLQDVMASDNYMSVRLVKNYNGHNFRESEDILGGTYSTVLMPSLKHGQTIWTSINIGMTDCSCDCDCGCRSKYVRPNNGEGMESTKRYFTYEWNGRHWMRKELLDGESVVVINTNPDQDGEYLEYRLVNGELKDVANLIYEKVVETFTPIVNDLTQDIEDLNAKIDAEIERSATRDDEMQNQLNDLEGRVTVAEGKIEQNIQDIANLNDGLAQTNERVDELAEKEAQLENSIEELRQEDVRLQGEIDELSESVENLDSQMIIQEGSEFDTSNGILTLKSKGGNNDIEVQFNLNFGTF